MIVSSLEHIYTSVNSLNTLSFKIKNTFYVVFFIDFYH